MEAVEQAPAVEGDEVGMNGGNDVNGAGEGPIKKRSKSQAAVAAGVLHDLATTTYNLSLAAIDKESRRIQEQRQERKAQRENTCVRAVQATHPSP